MRKEILVTIAAFLGSAQGYASDLPVVTVQPDRIFTPTGFDDNDNAQVVVDGLLPNTCYKLTDGIQDIDYARRIITIEARAELADGACSDVLVPFTYEFNFGSLGQGDWLVRTEDGALEKKLHVAEASSAGPDDQMYASVDNAYVQDDGPQGYAIVIEGTYSNTCMVWDKTQLIHKDPLVLEVLPIVKMQDRDDCQNRTIHFKGVKVRLPDISEGRFLLHVRSMSGRSVNRVFTMGFAGPTN